MKFKKWTLGLAGIAALALMEGINQLVGGPHGAGAMMAIAPLVVIPKNGKDVEGVRNFLTNFQQLCSTSAIYEGPLKQLFDELGAKLKAALEALPKDSTGNWSVNDQADSLFSLLACANNAAAALGLELSKLKNQMAGMVVLDDVLAAGTVIKKDDVAGQVTAAVTAAIAERTGEKGDLTTKELSQQLCSASHAKGIEEGIAQRNQQLADEQAALKVVSDRKQELTTAGLPLPEAEAETILKAAQADFDAAKTTTTARLKKFTEAGIDLPASLAGKVWLPEAGYKTFESTVFGVAELKNKKPVDEPLATGGLPAAGGGKIIV